MKNETRNWETKHNMISSMKDASLLLKIRLCYVNIENKCTWGTKEPVMQCEEELN